MRLFMNRVKSFGLPAAGILIFLLAFSSATAIAQTGRLVVTCVGPSGAPEKDVKVSAIPHLAAKGKDKKTDAAGTAVFDKMDNGVYRVVGRKAGFAPALYEFTAVNNGAASVTLNLSAGADSKLYFEDQALDRRANVLLDQGIKAMEAGDAAEAEQLIAQALEIKSSAADMLYYYGISQQNQGKFEQALESFQKAADNANLILSNTPMPKFGGPGGMMGGPPPGGMGGPPPGGMGGPPPGGMGGPPPGGMGGPMMIYDMISKNAAQQIASIPVLKAEAAYGAKRYDEAVALYDEAIKINPQNTALYSNKALALTQAGKHEEALASVNKALELNPADERAIQVKKAIDGVIENDAREKANTLLTDGNNLLESDASAALKKYQEANVLTGEKQAVIWRQSGRAHAKLNQDAEAVAAFKKAIEFAPADQLESYQMSLAQHHLNAKRPEEALDIVVAGVKDPEQRLLELFTKTKNNPDSIPFATAALERVVKMNPSNYDAIFELGQVYYMDKKDGQAQELLNRYIENGKDEVKIQTAKDFMILLARRNKTD